MVEGPLDRLNQQDGSDDLSEVRPKQKAALIDDPHAHE